MKKKPDQGLLLFLCSWAAASLFMTLHALIYNWHFLPRHAEGYKRQFFISGEILLRYWQWLPGRVMIIINIILLLLPFLVLHLASRIDFKHTDIIDDEHENPMMRGDR